MKISELISFQPQPSTKTADQRQSRLSKVAGPQIGQGTFSTVYQPNSNKRQGQVVKTGVLGHIDGQERIVRGNDISSDGFSSYLKMVHDLRVAGKDNPCFLKFTDFKLYKEADGKLHFVAKIEHLTPLNSERIVSNDQLVSAIEQKYFHVSSDENSEYQKIKNRAPGWGMFAETLVWVVYQIVNEYTHLIKDPELADSLKIIREFAQKNNFGDDLGPKNMMWRTTGSVPQLVLSDPLV